MSRFRVFSVLLCVAAAAGLAAVPAAAGPRIDSPEALFDFGERDTDEVVEHAFVIRNIGDAPLELLDVRSSCGCTVADLPKRTLAPGESTELEATFNLRGRRGNQSTSITIQSNDPTQPYYRLQFSGVARSPIEVEPATVMLGRILSTDVIDSTVNLRANSEDLSFEVQSVDSTNPLVQVASETIEPGRAYAIKVSSGGGPLPVGNLQANVRVRTNNPRVPIVTFFVTGMVVGPIEVRPARLNLMAQDDPDRTYTSRLEVLPGSVQGFEITGVTLPDPEMEYSVEAQPNGGYHIRVSNVRATDAIQGKDVVITTDVPEMPELRVPIFILRRTAPAAAAQ